MKLLIFYFFDGKAAVLYSSLTSVVYLNTLDRVGSHEQISQEGETRKHEFQSLPSAA